MKIKKLVSIGALGLALTMFSSIGAFAAERPTNDKIKSDMIKVFLGGTSPVSYNITANTQVKNVISISKLQADLQKYGFTSYTEGAAQNYATLNYALGLVEPDKTIMYNAKKIALTLSTQDKFDDLLSEVRAMMLVLKDIENSDESTKLQIEADIRAVVKGSNPTLDVVFGKNKDGKSTMTIVQGNQIILQLNSGNAYTISKALGNDADKLEYLAGLFQLIPVTN
ncbi:hypothetical protein GKZ28_18260 [Clostridium chromiireducens]|uniref:Uncharacterized protein n=1 Tax=Clostridium chromiireducens TaxID=225345 RepID=A0A964RPX8_9CLOT|nr:hypothetical protein [Clostridium chromiireducens]MVX65629.1 hypothetical protein [Clostridium chromiireducens]